MTAQSPTTGRRGAAALRAPAGSPLAPEPVLLIIADISGYTRYMTANAKTLSHSHVIITELVEAIVREIKLPLAVAKLEGDAVFLFCRKHDPAHPWCDTRRILGGKLLTFFRTFNAKVTELSESTTCTCNACTHIEKLRLKVIVHSGEALFHRVFNSLELAGVDVILVHRLLKNSVAATQYLLLTEAAHHDLEFSEPVHFDAGMETCDDIGQVKTLVYHPETITAQSATSQPAPPAPATLAGVDFTPSCPVRFTRTWKLYWRLWFAPLTGHSDPPRASYHHVSNCTSAASRTGFALFTLLLTPFMVFVGAIFVVHRAWLAESRSHPPGCNCNRHS